ncbi:transposase [Bradyrhizobium elkanii]|nr:transposase [Bradyrhizobium elkanii]
MRATINAAIITSPRHRLAILIVVRFPPRLSRYNDDRRIVSGIIHMLQSGARWRDCPREYGPYTTIYNRFNRWAKRGRWCAIFEALAKPGEDGVVLSLDSTSIKAHRCASGGKGGSTIKQSAARAEAARQKSMR